MKTFICTISNTCLKKHITFKFKQRLTSKDLFSQISKEFNLEENQFSISNLPSDDKINNINDKYELFIKIRNPCSNVLFQFKDNQKILLENCSKMDFNGIIDLFRKKKFLFSDFCVYGNNNFHFQLWGIEIPRKDFRFSCIPEGTSIFVENTILIKYHHLNFCFAENEKVNDANNFIKKNLIGCDYGRIISAKNYEFIQSNSFLNKNWDYKIKSLALFHFRIGFKMINRNFDYFINVAEIKNIFSIALCDNKELTSKNIIIFDKDKSKASDNRFIIDLIDKDNWIIFDIDYKPSNNVENSEINYNPKDKMQINDDYNPINKKHFDYQKHENEDNIYRQIQKVDPVQINKNKTGKLFLVIKFISEDNSEDNFKKSFSTDTKMGEISQFIAEKYKIKEQIDIKYRYKNAKISIDREMEIEDIKNEMKQEGKNGKTENVLYFAVKKTKESKAKIEGNKLKQKKSKLADDTNKITNDKKSRQKMTKLDDESESSDIEKPYKPSNKLKNEKNKTKQRYSKLDKCSDDDDDESSDRIRKSPTKLKEDKIRSKQKKSKYIESSDNDDSSEKNIKSVRKFKEDKNKTKQMKSKVYESSSDDDSKERNHKSPSKIREDKSKYKQKKSKYDDDDTDNGEENERKSESVRKFKEDKNKTKQIKSKVYESSSDDDSSNRIRKSPNKMREDKSKYKQKKSKYDDDDTDNDEENERKSKSMRKFKEDKNKNKQIKSKVYESSSDDDSNERNHKSPSKNKSKQKKSKYDDDDDDDTDDDSNDKKYKSPSKRKQTNSKQKYFYQTSTNSNICSIELDSDATVLTMKSEIAKLNKVSNLANIKIIFAGKDLLNDIVLKSLEVESTILFVYIRTQEDIFLMTAKALVVSRV